MALANRALVFPNLILSLLGQLLTLTFGILFVGVNILKLVGLQRQSGNNMHPVSELVLCCPISKIFPQAINTHYSFSLLKYLQADFIIVSIKGPRFDICPM